MFPAVISPCSAYWERADIGTIVSEDDYSEADCRPRLRSCRGLERIVRTESESVKGMTKLSIRIYCPSCFSTLILNSNIITQNNPYFIQYVILSILRMSVSYQL